MTTKKSFQITNWATYNSQATDREQALINLAKAKELESKKLTNTKTK